MYGLELVVEAKRSYYVEMDYNCKTRAKINVLTPAQADEELGGLQYGH